MFLNITFSEKFIFFQFQSRRYRKSTKRVLITKYNNFLQTFVDASSSRAIWLLFLVTSTSLEQFFTDINIPFDFQFLVAQPQSDHVVVLTEVYRVSPTLPLQTYRFGNWTAGGGLTWPSQGFYRRRHNLQGHVIRAAHRNASESLWMNDKINLFSWREPRKKGV